MPQSKKNIQSRILQLLKENPEGLRITDIRSLLHLTTEHQHLDKRIREMRDVYDIPGERRNGQHFYVLKGLRKVPITAARIDKTTRARILHRDNSKCQMCGRTATEDNVKLHIDHKVPREWGGASQDDNLWALCAECNEGKKNFFSSITDEGVKKAMLDTSIHKRIGEMLKFHMGTPVPKSLLAIVTYTHDDWEKRLRELREIGWKYRVLRRKENGRAKISFILDQWAPWPDDVAATILAVERAKKKNRK